MADCYNDIGLVYQATGEYSKALPSLEEAPEIRENTLPPNHPDLATSYNKIDNPYTNMDEYSKALSYFERALDVRQGLVPPNQPDLQNIRRKIIIVKKN